MKRIVLNSSWSSLLIVLTFVLTIFSCNPDPNHNKDRVVPTDTIVQLSIASVKSFYHGEDIPIDKASNFKQINVTGTLISDPQAKNTDKGYLILQQDEDGIAILLKDSTDDIPFSVNEVLNVNIQKGILRDIKGNLVITGLSLSDVTRTGETDSIAPQPVSLKTLAGNFDAYNETLVKISAVGTVPSPSPGETYSGAKVLFDGSGEAETINLYTFPRSTLADKQVKLNATYTAIAMYNTNSRDSIEKQIWLRNEDDIDSVKTIPINTPIVITGFLADPRGSDQPLKGSTTHYSSTGVTVTHPGGYQYIQFMALKDIDFSKTPYSIVTVYTLNNGYKPTAKGYTEGGLQTCKFDLNSGFAAQGTFFYLGTGAKVINSYWPEGLSTDISNANWIYNKVFNTGVSGEIVGDGFGETHGSILTHNGDNASGIAVFEGTNVTPTTVPIDAIFFDGPPGVTWSPPYGYLIPVTDWYNPINEDTGEPQPYFGEGSNTKTVDASLSPQHGFVKLGGIITPNGWIQARDPSNIILEYNSQLDDIEKGSGVTSFRKY